MPSSSELGEVASTWIRQSRPNSKWKGVALPDSRSRGLSGAARGSAARIHPTVEADSCKVLREFHGSTPPTSLQLLGLLGGRQGVMLSHLQRCWTTSAVNSVPGSLRRDRGNSNVDSNSRSFLAT